MTDIAESFSVAKQPSLIRVRWKLITGVTILVMAGAFMADHFQHRSYTSSASVELGYQIFASGAEPLPPDLGTAKAVATSTLVLASAAGPAGLTATQIQSGLSVSNPANTSVLVFTFNSASPQQAQRVAQAVAVAFSDYQNVNLAAVSRAQAIIAKGGHSDSTLSVEQATIIDAAPLPAAPAGHSLTLDLLVALIAGLGLGLGAAVLVDRASDRLRGPADLQSQVGRPLLAEIPAPSWRRPQPWRRQLPPDLVSAISQDPRLLAAFRALRVRVQDEAGSPPNLTVLVTRPCEDVRPALPTALGLAVSFALSGRRVVLVGADLHANTLGRLFGARDARGLAELLREKTWELPLLNTSLPGLRLLVEGADTQGAEELVDQPRLSWLLTALSSGADVVLIDGSPLEAPESLAIVASASLVLLEVDGRRIDR
ncbi:MAG TPA: hypothetical protein VEH29_18790, partial [Acidimicrobiales bacterium]|nr:hypothetical protein [Acidimicrobiales bacterium]